MIKYVKYLLYILGGLAGACIGQGDWIVILGFLLYLLVSFCLQLVTDYELENQT